MRVVHTSGVLSCDNRAERAVQQRVDLILEVVAEPLDARQQVRPHGLLVVVIPSDAIR